MPLPSPVPLARFTLSSTNLPILRAFTEHTYQTFQSLSLDTPHAHAPPKRVQKLTLLRSPHINKTAREQFQKTTHKREFNIPMLGNEKKQHYKYQVELAKEYLTETCPPGVSMKVQQWQINYANEIKPNKGLMSWIENTQERIEKLKQEKRDAVALERSKVIEQVAEETIEGQAAADEPQAIHTEPIA